MILSAEQIKNITHGAENVILESDGIHFYRFKEEEQNLYKDNFDLYFNCIATSHVQLRFKTDAKALRMKGKVYVKDYDQRDCYFDILVDGKRVENSAAFKYRDCEKEKTVTADFAYDVNLGDGEKTVNVVFHWFCAVALDEVELSEATYVENVNYPKTLLMYGDSITHGACAKYPSETYAFKLAEYLGAELYCKGIGGDIYSPQLAKVESDIKPDYVTVAYGTNDWSKCEKDEFYKNCSDFFEIITKKFKESKIFAISPIWRADYEAERKFGDFTEIGKIIKNVSEKYDNVSFIDGWELVPHQKELYEDLYLHPNSEGFEYYFNNLKKEIIKKMGEM